MYEDTKNPLIGRKVTAVYLAKDKEAIRFDIEGGEPIIARVDADCCSHTWIEMVETPENALGTVTKVEDVDMPGEDGEDSDGDYIRYYGCKIHTEKGSMLLDYRNSSNGYYGGNLVWPGEYFYGGVYGQNVSAEEWEKLA